MKIALAQISPVTGDLRGNTETIIREIAAARDKGADMVIFPEMAITGYCISDLIEDREFVAANKKMLGEIAKNAGGIAVVVGFIDYDGKKRNEDGKIRKYNAAAVLQDGKIIGIAHKSLLPNYRYFDDKRYFSPGEERKPIEAKIKGRIAKLGVSICEDMWDDDYEIKPVRELAERGAEVIININASPFVPGKFAKREGIITRHIKENGLPFIYLNTVGAADNGKNIIPFDGESLVYDCFGNLIARGKKFEEEIFFAELELKKRGIAAEKPVFNREKEIYDALVMSLKDYAKQVGFKRAIIPISGGIDSSLGLAICVEAFGRESVTAYNLPSMFNTETTKSIAKRLAGNLGVEYRIIPIQEIDNKIKDIFETNNHKIENKTARENLHARIRGILMMLESNDTFSLLISNGNKTEIGLGYSTLYGDMCGGLSIIGDLSKVDVYKISRYVNEKFGKEIIPEEAFTIKPSAELSEGQYDPFDYYVTSPIVNMLVEKRLSPNEIIEMFRTQKLDEGEFVKDPEGKSAYEKHDIKSFAKLVHDTYNLLRKSVYKRLQGPPIVVVTERAFGFDLRETLINKWGEKHEA